MVGAAVLEVQVVGVLPDIEGQQRPESVGDGVVGAGALEDREGAVFVGGKPHPTGAENADAFGFELGLERLETPPLLIDTGGQMARRGGLGGIGRSELGEVQIVVQDLAGIVEYGAGWRLTDCFLKRQAFQPAAGQQFVEVVDVCFQMLSVVESQGLRADDRFQGVGRKR